MSAPEAPSALPRNERLPTLDILRGFALMGILIMNMPSFSASMFAETDGSHMWPGQVDQMAEHVRDLLFSGKFNGIFSLLFGLGFTIQFAHMQQQDPAGAGGMYLRRLLVLFAIGVLHACIFWIGDILHLYAILGLIMVFGLRHLSNRGIVALFVATLIWPIVGGVIRLNLMTPEIVQRQVAIGKAFHADSVLAFGQGGFADTIALNTRLMVYEYTDGWALFGGFGGYVMILMTMLIGMYAGRQRWAHRIPELMPHIKRLMWWMLLAGLLFGAAFTTIFELNRAPGPSVIKMVGGLCYRLSRLAMMLFYILAIVRLTQTPMGMRLFAPLAAAGRMPLTNYLMQTAISILIFYQWGLGYWGQMGPAMGLLLALAIFWVIQVPWSLWWLKSHERGPMEVLWARLTYRRKPLAAAPATAGSD